MKNCDKSNLIILDKRVIELDIIAKNIRQSYIFDKFWCKWMQNLDIILKRIRQLHLFHFIKYVKIFKLHIIAKNIKKKSLHS